MIQPSHRRRLRQAHYHAGALTIIAVFYVPPVVYTLATLARIV